MQSWLVFSSAVFAVYQEFSYYFFDNKLEKQKDLLSLLCTTRIKGKRIVTRTSLMEYILKFTTIGNQSTYVTGNSL